jgi:hypothetical protein
MTSKKSRYEAIFRLPATIAASFLSNLFCDGMQATTRSNQGLPAKTLQRRASAEHLQPLFTAKGHNISRSLSACSTQLGNGWRIFLVSRITVSSLTRALRQAFSSYPVLTALRYANISQRRAAQENEKAPICIGPDDPFSANFAS